MKPSEIKQAIASKGYSLSMVAEALSISLATVSGVVCGHTQSRRVANALSKIIDKPVCEIFPDVQAYQSLSVPRGAINRERGVAQLQQLLAS
ncbi:helix-turn-helix domain-containing protein [Pseudoalteromonas sp. T1lg65]|uniref:helix-turn-helix domain-containing protein n=1 Tax=Pseudoalteromonas sp. T1lg65 TaxID=2077101 RepID=UPI003F78F337